MRHKSSKKIFGYWNNLRGNRPAPDRREIEPSDIRELLGETFILEIDPDFGSISFRLAGSRLCSTYGKELKGEGFLSIWREEDNLRIRELALNVFNHMQPCVISYEGKTASGKSVECEMTLFPLLNGSENACRILGAAFPLQRVSLPETEPVCENHLRYARQIEAGLLMDTPPISPANLAREVNHKPAGRKIGHLTVISGGMDQ